jgi:hypothetical protein
LAFVSPWTRAGRVTNGPHLFSVINSPTIRTKIPTNHHSDTKSCDDASTCRYSRSSQRNKQIRSRPSTRSRRQKATD